MKILESFCKLSLSCVFLSPLMATADVSKEYRLDESSPLAINWQPCYTDENPNLLCAQYPVPLNYQSTRKNAQTIQLALIKLPARNPAKKPLGSLFLNPGGPGGSGVSFVRYVGEYLFNQEVRDQYDLIGFDPRGVNLSQPITCGLTVENALQILPPFEFPVTRTEEKQKIKSDKTLSARCAKNGSEIMHHMTTANVARDLDLLRQAVGDKLLNYVGYSYGSYLGVTYANLFPQKVGRLVVDGVIDPIAWSTGNNWSGWIVPVTTRLESDKNSMATLNEFFRLCDLSGPAGCLLAGDSAARFDQIAQRLKANPLPIFQPDGTVFELTYSRLISEALGAMYSSASWAYFAELLAFIEWQMPPEAIGQQYALLRQELGIEDIRVPDDNGLFTFHAVMCSDSDNPELAAFWPLWAEESERQNGYFSRLWTWNSSMCATWPGSKKSRYMGPFTKKTKNPVLVASTEFDPATPYSGAKAVAHLLPNSRLVTVAGWGHTTPGLSACADKITATYLLSGALPKTDTLCQQDYLPFGLPGAALALSDEAVTSSRRSQVNATSVEREEGAKQVRKAIIRSNRQRLN